MNGARAEHYAKTSSAPAINITTMMGMSHHFLRTLGNAQDSENRKIVQTPHHDRQIAADMALRRSRAMMQRVTAKQVYRQPYRYDHREIQDRPKYPRRDE